MFTLTTEPAPPPIDEVGIKTISEKVCRSYFTFFNGKLTGRVGGNQRQLRKDRRRHNAAGFKKAFARK